MEKEFIYGKMGLITQAHFRMITGMGMDKWHGMMEDRTKDNG